MKNPLGEPQTFVEFMDAHCDEQIRNKLKLMAIDGIEPSEEFLRGMAWEMIYQLRDVPHFKGALGLFMMKGLTLPQVIDYLLTALAADFKRVKELLDN